MKDRDLLELAANAVGCEYECTSHTGYPEDDQHQIRSDTGRLIDWNPLTDDGCALQLAVNLGMLVDVRYGPGDTKLIRVTSWLNPTNAFVAEEIGEAYSSTRRAIVRAAAAIGKQ